jgi:hypothetical protein
MNGTFRFRPPFMPRGTHLNVRAGRILGERRIGFAIEYTPDEPWLSSGYGGQIAVLVWRSRVGVWWWPTDPEGVLAGV